MGVATRQNGYVHGEPGVERDCLEHVAHERAGEVPADEVEGEAVGLPRVNQVGAAGHIHDSLCERIVEGHERIPIPANPCLVPKCLP